MKITPIEMHNICSDIQASTESQALDLAVLEQVTTMLLTLQGAALGMDMQRLVKLQHSLIAEHADTLGISCELEAARGAIQHAGEVMEYISTYAEPDAQPGDV